MLQSCHPTTHRYVHILTMLCGWWSHESMSAVLVKWGFYDMLIVVKSAMICCYCCCCSSSSRQCLYLVPGTRVPYNYCCKYIWYIWYLLPVYVELTSFAWNDRSWLFPFQSINNSGSFAELNRKESLDRDVVYGEALLKWTESCWLVWNNAQATFRCN
jgi:hypothetical protein